MTLYFSINDISLYANKDIDYHYSMKRANMIGKPCLTRHISRLKHEAPRRIVHGRQVTIIAGLLRSLRWSCAGFAMNFW